jgi:hypothetical protein
MAKINIPVIPLQFNIKEQDYPISQGENLYRALSHEKPLWMPNFMGSSQMAPVHNINTPSNDGSCDYRDWFGIGFKYSEAQGSPTPIKPVLSEVVNWEKELLWPNIADYNLSIPAPDFIRDPNRLVYTRLPSIGFQQLHSLEDFEQALVDLVTEPETCRSLFEANVDFFIKAFDEKNKAYKYDYVFYSDDWGTARAPFFSVDTMRETLLEPTKRFIKHVKESGVKIVFHNCGQINHFLPLIIEDIQPDGMDIQFINDIEGFMRKYGNTVTIDLQKPDEMLFFDPDTALETIKERARAYVDTFGAQVMPGAGGIVMQSAVDEERINVFWDELYNYSLEKYRTL